MAVNYVCSQCGSRTQLPSPVPGVSCQQCNIPMQPDNAVPQGKVAAGRHLKVAKVAHPAVPGTGLATTQVPPPPLSPTAPAGPPQFSLPGQSPANSQYGVPPVPAARSQGGASSSLGQAGETSQTNYYNQMSSGGLAQVERMMETARRQAEREMELAVESARLKADQERQQILAATEKERQQIISTAEEQVEYANQEIQKQMATALKQVEDQRVTSANKWEQELAARKKEESAKLELKLTETKKALASKLVQEIKQKREEGHLQIDAELNQKREEGQKILVEKALKVAEEAKNKAAEIVTKAEEQGKQKTQEAEKILVEAKNKCEAEKKRLTEAAQQFEEQKENVKKTFMDKLTSDIAEIKEKAEKSAVAIREKAEKESAEQRQDLAKIRLELIDKEKDISSRLQAAADREKKFTAAVEEAKSKGLKVISVTDADELEKLRGELEKQRQDSAAALVKAKQEFESYKTESARVAQEQQNAYQRQLMNTRRAEIDASAGARKIQILRLNIPVIAWFFALLIGMNCAGWQAIFAWLVLALLTLDLLLSFGGLLQHFAILFKKKNKTAMAAAQTTENQTAIGNTANPTVGLDNNKKMFPLKGSQKNNAFPGLKKQEKPKKDEPKKDEPKKDEPKKDEPKKDEPKKDEPKKDEPKKDEPKKDEPKKDEPKKDELLQN